MDVGFSLNLTDLIFIEFGPRPNYCAPRKILNQMRRARNPHSKKKKNTRDQCKKMAFDKQAQIVICTSSLISIIFTVTFLVFVPFLWLLLIGTDLDHLYFGMEKY